MIDEIKVYLLIQFNSNKMMNINHLYFKHSQNIPNHGQAKYEVQYGIQCSKQNYVSDTYLKIRTHAINIISFSCFRRERRWLIFFI